MNNFEMPKIEIVKFACDSEAITTSTYVEISINDSYNENITIAEVVSGGGAFLDQLSL